jgi:hypothetical protein
MTVRIHMMATVQGFHSIGELWCMRRPFVQRFGIVLWGAVLLLVAVFLTLLELKLRAIRP